MTKDEVIEIANKVKLPHEYANGEPMWLDNLEEFVKLVAEKEREKCAKLCEEYFERVMASRIRAMEQE